MAGSSRTYIQRGLWGFLAVSGVEADRLECIQGKGLSVDTKKPPITDRRVAVEFVGTIG